MDFQTKIALTKQSNNLIDYKSSIVLLGSCFVENIGEKLNYYKFNNHKNPFGILFHPKAIESLIQNAITDNSYTEKDIFYHNEQWFCFEAHSKLSASVKEDILDCLNYKVIEAKKNIRNASHVIITLGSAWVYRFTETNSLVANCHKLPQKLFSKELLAVTEIVSSLKNIVILLKSLNSSISVIFTVSPIRHIKDGFVDNNRSKAHLIAGIHEYLEQESKMEITPSSYFPSFEIMMDELRDYRFYNDDMIHPNNTAINYIWKQFVDVWMSKETVKIMQSVEDIQKALHHKPFNPESIAHKKFMQTLEDKISVLNRNFPYIKF